jgi:hypothetical protein
MTQAVKVLPIQHTFQFLSNAQIFNIVKTTEHSESFDRYFRSDVNSFYDRVSVFYYSTKARLQFAVAPAFWEHFGLIKGLLEFSRAGKVMFGYDRNNKYISTDIETKDFGQLSNLFSCVYGSLISELRFKATLNKVIRFENLQRQQANELYSELQSSGKSLHHFFKTH